jgi:serine phosphatase RsbU (regulator of sigma subunit)/PAS domain-containing protein
MTRTGGFPTTADQSRAAAHARGLPCDVRILLDHVGPITDAYARVRWSETAIGEPGSWSPTLRTTVDMMLRSKFPMTLLWGPERVLLYNEAYVELIGDKHPDALGQRAVDIFPEVWDQIGPLMEQVMSTGEAVFIPDASMPLHRRGFLEECHFTFCYSPVRDTAGVPLGVLDVVTETTREVVYRRRMGTLHVLGVELPHAEDAAAITRAALALLRGEPADFAEVDIAPDERQELPLDFDTWDGAPIRVSIPTTAPQQLALSVLPAPTVVVDEEYRAFVGLVAATIGQALERAYADEVQRRMNSVQRQMSEAFQRSLLPRQDQFTEPEIAVRYRPAVAVAQLGGDWYDFFRLPSGGLGVVIGDVAGHDQRAAAAMAQVRNLVRGVAVSIGSDAPSVVLEGLERALELTATEAIATAIMARVVRRDDGRLDVTWSNAGHPPPVLIEADGAARLLLTDPDLLLGLDASTPRRQHQVVVDPGATLVLYTDGLVESRILSMDAGLARLVGALEGTQDRTLERLCDEVLAIAPGSEDDIALLLLRG